MPPKRRLLFGIPPGQWFAVSVIIVLLYAILYPVYGPHPQIIRRIGCQSNLKQLGLAYVQYEQDADGIFPSGLNAAGNGWAGQLYPYARTTYIYRCPDDSAEIPFISYAENQNIVRQKLANLPDPHSTVALYGFTTLNCDPTKAETVSATGLNAPQNSTRHSRSQSPFGLNFLLADGHVKYLSPGQVSNGASAVPPTHIEGYSATFAVK